MDVLLRAMFRGLKRMFQAVRRALPKADPDFAFELRRVATDLGWRVEGTDSACALTRPDGTVFDVRIRLSIVELEVNPPRRLIGGVFPQAERVGPRTVRVGRPFDSGNTSALVAGLDQAASPIADLVELLRFKTEAWAVLELLRASVDHRTTEFLVTHLEDLERGEIDEALSMIATESPDPRRALLEIAERGTPWASLTSIEHLGQLEAVAELETLARRRPELLSTIVQTLGDRAEDGLDRLRGQMAIAQEAPGGLTEVE